MYFLEIKTEKRKEECYAIIKCGVVVKTQENERAVRRKEYAVLCFFFMLEDVEKVAPKWLRSNGMIQPSTTVDKFH